jgi:hypothetical protein
MVKTLTKYEILNFPNCWGRFNKNDVIYVHEEEFLIIPDREYVCFLLSFYSLEPGCPVNYMPVLNGAVVNIIYNSQALE